MENEKRGLKALAKSEGASYLSANAASIRERKESKSKPPVMVAKPL